MKEKRSIGVKSYVWIFVLCVFMLLFPVILDLTAGFMKEKIVHSIDRNAWFGGLCSLVPTTVVAISTFYMTRRADIREEKYRILLERPRIIGTEFEMQVVVDSISDKEFQKKQRYKYIENGWVERINDLKNSFWLVFSGKNLNNHILKEMETVGVSLEVDGGKLEYNENSFLQRIELYPDKETDFTIKVACCLNKEYIEKIESLFTSYVKGYASEMWVKCRLKVSDDMEREHVIIYQAKLKSGGEVLNYGAEKQFFRVTEPEKNRKNNRNSRT